MRVFTDSNDPAFWADPAAIFARLFQANERVLRAPDGAICLFGQAELTAFARHPAIEGVAVGADAFGKHTDIATLYGAGLFARAGASHRALRRAALAGLGVVPVAARAAEIEAIVMQAIARCPTDAAFDLVQKLVLPLTARVWAQIAGYPPHAEAPLADAVATLSDPTAEPAAQAGAARRVRALTQAAWEEGTSPFMREIADAMPVASNRDPVALVASMAVDGIDSAAAGLGGAIAVLARQSPDIVAHQGIDACLQEALRLAMPVILSMRQATEDVTLAGLSVERGTILWMWWGAGCVDPAAYRAPVRFLPGRNGPRAPVFGAGAHACLGHALIRTAAMPLIRATFTQARRLVAVGPAGAAQPWRLSRLPRQDVGWIAAGG
ncbi:MAG: cytochrome P450 [Pararhodobacter sp.]|nr:cytochrome P450 [Pararhodobacter sp.]